MAVQVYAVLMCGWFHGFGARSKGDSSNAAEKAERPPLFHGEENQR
jgi:hypothetical protein